MASCSPPTDRARRRRPRPPAADSNSGVDLPPDALYEILLRLPAKELCRLRLVHRSWRRVTTDPLFIKAHTARHPGSLFLASFRGDKTHMEITDLSGNVVKRIGNVDGNMVLCNRLDHLVCVATEENYCCVLNPATGAAHVLPESPAEVHMEREQLRKPYTSFAFGQVASTGEHKVLRMFWPNINSIESIHWSQLCEVFTITGAGVAAHGRWRAKQSREILVKGSTSIPAPAKVYHDVNCSAVIGGVVYFLMYDVYECLMLSNIGVGFDPDHIASFDLETEQWREDIQGPISSRFAENGADFLDYVDMFNHLTLGELKDHLVLVYSPGDHSATELWFLTDFDNGVWVKEYNIQIESDILNNQRFVKPLVLLDDGRIVIHLVLAGVLIVYDPITNSCTEVEMRDLHAVGVYTGSLLSMQDGDML